MLALGLSLKDGPITIETPEGRFIAIRLLERTRGGGVRIGIEADRDVRVLRYRPKEKEEADSGSVA